VLLDVHERVKTRAPDQYDPGRLVKFVFDHLAPATPRSIWYRLYTDGGLSDAITDYTHQRGALDTSAALSDVLILFYHAFPPESGIDHYGRQIVQLELRHHLRLRAAASVIYDTVYPGPEWAPVSFEQAERLETVRYRQAVAAALLVRPVLADRAEQ